MVEGIKFDPGFAPYILAFRGTVEYLYADINRFKNFSQKKIKFRQYYKKILELLYNNVGFYIGCLMWAGYILTQPEQDIINNPCLNQDYDEEENVSDVDFVIKFLELFPKDVKYFIAEEFNFDEDIIKIVKLYKEFLLINKGFVASYKNTDIKIPKDVNIEKAENFKITINNVIESGDLSQFLEYINLIFQNIT